ncbi:hypothetical protein AAFC00_000899 [Neodothiora populina]|uniref:DNA replication factor Cdt1 C-terminal domain-containing protein n=1 Tax=Neodothiora populina TaxID=2781224 RepID=A0ABR3PME8_9PEZI
MPTMMRRRATVQPAEQSKQTIPTAAQKSISHYGRVMKPQKVDHSAKKRRGLLEEGIQISPIGDVIEVVPRKVQKTRAAEPTIPESQPITSASTRKRKNDDVTETPQHKRFKNDVPPTPAETPSRAALHLFDKLTIDNVTSTSVEAQIPYDTPPLTPRSLGEAPGSDSIEQLPPPLQDLARLFSSFLTSTSLYYAHNGSGSPLQLSFVLHNVTKAWKKRAVTETDIRRLLGILGDSAFEIVDNGDGMICLEQVDAVAGHFNQPELRLSFEKSLCQQWSTWVRDSSNKRQEVSRFIDQLPLIGVREGDLVSVKPAGSVRGQNCLDDIRRGAAQAKLLVEKAGQRSVVAAEAKTSAGVTSRGSKLLDRILAKQQSISSRGGGPTQEEMDRKTALGRIEDVVPVLDVLAGSRPRVSFSTQTLISNLQNSLRNPISREEAEHCLELISGEIAPGFVSMIKSGQVKGIVIVRGGRPTNAELRQRLDRAGA